MTEQSSTKHIAIKSRKLPARFLPVAFSFYMAAIMAFLMCLLITATNTGFTPDYLALVWRAYQIAMPCAFVCVLAVRPLVLKLVKLTVATV